MNAATRILERSKKEWGERDVYHATSDELITLCLGGAEPLFLNKNNGDGTFSHRVVYKGTVFATTSTYPIKLSC